MLVDIGGDADGDPLGGFPDRVARAVCVARGGLDPAVTEEPPDDRQAFAERQRSRSEAVPKVMGWAANEPYIEHRGSSNVSARHR